MPPPAPRRPVYTVILTPRPGVDGVLALRSLLKIAGRRLGLRAVAIQGIPPGYDDPLEGLADGEAVELEG